MPVTRLLSITKYFDTLKAQKIVDGKQRLVGAMVIVRISVRSRFTMKFHFSRLFHWTASLIGSRFEP